MDRPPAIVPTYPAELPISARRDELLTVIDDHQVVIVAGETGSGKSTQLPKMCLELGRGARAGGAGTLIGHTQPRRLAARTVAERVASELGSDVGDTVGYAVRFNDQVGADTRLKLMTDGILLAELGRDRDLRRYDTIIVDEAHERSLNIDFILGYLRQLLPRRADLKVIVTSATIDTERFAAHFASPDGTPAPIVEVSGRTYPVEMRYRPLEARDDSVVAAADATQALLEEGMADVLVFASGEREIRDTADELAGRALANTEIVPLFARLSSAEQHRVFAAHSARRVVIATNIAETSLTVPGILSVIDPGTARISRYNKRTKVQRLPIEAISQASADQRSGRCGRVAPGVCVRLYAEDDYLERPEFTEPEILRTNLASVILQMTDLGLGDVEAFPFVEAPDSRTIVDGVTLLEDLGALETDRPAHDRRLTPIGKRMARLPLDPTLGRMILEAERHGCVYEVMVIAAALSIQDVRERPSGEEQAAAESHARFKVQGSDFMTMVALWRHLQERQRALSSSKFRREVRREYLHYVRIREWQDVVSQIRGQVKAMKLPINSEPADMDAVHRALLAGLVANVARLDEPDKKRNGTKRSGNKAQQRRGPATYRGPRGVHFSIGRGSVLSRSPSKWVVAAELVETDRMWARTLGTVQPGWIESAAEHLLTYSYDTPTWNLERGSAQVVERVSLRGLPIVEGRTVQLSRVDRSVAREFFVLHALVRGEWESHFPFVQHNVERMEQVRELEQRQRADLLVPEDDLFDHFAALVPDDVFDTRSFERWWRDTSQDDPGLMDLRVEDLVVGDGMLDPDAYPTTWGTATAASGDAVPLPIHYEFVPGASHDGVVFEMPLAVVNEVDPDRFDWLVPGLRVELFTTLVRALPKAHRRELSPIPETSAELAAALGPDDGPLLPTLAEALSRRLGAAVDTAPWRNVELPDHLRPHVRVVDGDRVVAQGADLGAIRRDLRAHVRAAVASPELESDGLVDWTIGDLPQVIESTRDGLVVHGYPAIVDFGDTCSVRVLASRREQRALHWNGVRRLLALGLPRPARVVQGDIDATRLLRLADSAHGSVTAAVADAQTAVLDEFLLEAGSLPFDEDAYAALRRRVRDHHAARLVACTSSLVESVAAEHRLQGRLAAPSPDTWDPALADISSQLAGLVFDGMCVAMGTRRLQHVPRYLEAVSVRLDRLRENIRTDADHTITLRRLLAEHAEVVAATGLNATLDDIRWQMEELRVQLFAQHVGTAEPVSAKRIATALAAVG